MDKEKEVLEYIEIRLGAIEIQTKMLREHLATLKNIVKEKKPCLKAQPAQSNSTADDK